MAGATRSARDGDGGIAGGDGTTVADAAERHRYEIARDGEVLGFAAYQKAAGLVVFTHTEIDPVHEGEGLGGALVRQALDDVRSQGLPVLALCPFVAAWMRRHPEYLDLDYRNPASRVTD